MLKFSVNGFPAPQGSKTRNKHGGIYDDNYRTLKPWRDAVRTEAQRAAHGGPITGPVRVLIGFRLPRPAGHYGARGALRPSAPRWPVLKKDDLDKLCRAVLDGLTAGGAYTDDGHVIELAAAKDYAVTPGADIEVWEVTE